jgi:hypothetical protein
MTAFSGCDLAKVQNDALFGCVGTGLLDIRRDVTCVIASGGRKAHTRCVSVPSCPIAVGAVPASSAGPVRRSDIGEGKLLLGGARFFWFPADSGSERCFSMRREVERATMETAVRSANGSPASADAALVGLMSAVACAAAGSWLGFSFLSRKRRLPVAGQVFLGVLAGCAGVMTWKKRQAEMDAAHHLIDHVHEVRDARWLKKNPVAYG